MATFDTWQDHDYTRQSHLKFWVKENGAMSYSLRTRIDQPHGLERLSSMAFARLSDDDDEEGIPRLATTSMDGTIKLWTYRILDTKTKASVTSQLGAWMCTSIMSYRSMAAVDCSFSSDGSILAVGHVSPDEQQGTVSLWNTETGTMMQTLPARSITNESERKLGERSLRALCNVRFIGEGRHTKIIASGLAGIRVWSALSLDVVFDEAHQASYLLTDPSGDSEVITLVRGRRCKTFNLASPRIEILSSRRLPVDSYTLPLHGAVAYPSSSPGERQYAVAAISQSGAVVLAGPSKILRAIQPHTTDTGASNIRALNSAPRPGNTRLFDEIFGPSPQSRSRDEPLEPTTIYDVAPSALKKNADELDLFDKQPTHLMPLVSTLWKELLLQSGGLKPYNEEAAASSATAQVGPAIVGQLSKREMKRQAKAEAASRREEERDGMAVDAPTASQQQEVTYIDEIPGIDELFKEIFIKQREEDEREETEKVKAKQQVKEKTTHHPLLGQFSKPSSSNATGSGGEMRRKSSSSAAKKAKKRESGGGNEHL